MVPYRDALRIVLDHTPLLGAEEVLLSAALGRVLADDIFSSVDVPPFDNSSVDGYAIRSSDAPSQRLQLSGAVPAGTIASIPLAPGQAMRIFTGSPIPRGADAVVMQEDTVVKDGFVSFAAKMASADFIRPRGSSIRQGAQVAAQGAVVRPPISALLASVGVGKIQAYRRPKVAIVGTGNELVAPGEPLAPGQIYEANTVALRQAIEGLGLEVVSCHLVRDEFEETKAAFAKALSADVVITSGGVSVGDHDLVRRAMADLGVEEKLWRVAMRPGKPFYFGVAPNGARVFGLPGNPVSALVTFYVLVRPALAQMIGLTTLGMRSAVLGSAVGIRGDRADFLRAREENGRAIVASGQDSHMLAGLAEADLLLYLPERSGPYVEGDIVDALPLRWNSFT